MPKKKKLPREDQAFITDSDQVSGAGDDLAELLAQEYLQAATSGESSEEDMRDQIVEEELGGPFLEGSPDAEFGRTRVARGKAEGGVTERNPLPTALGSLAVAAADEFLDETEDESVEEAGLDGLYNGMDLDAEVASRVEPVIPSVVTPKIRRRSTRTD